MSQPRGLSLFWLNLAESCWFFKGVTGEIEGGRREGERLEVGGEGRNGRRGTEAREETGGEGQRAGDWRILLEGAFACCWGCHSIILISSYSFLNCHSNILISTNLKAKT